MITNSRPRKTAIAAFFVWLAYNNRAENEKNESSDVGRRDGGYKVSEFSCEKLLP